MATQLEKAKVFRELHERKQAFIIPNPWDVGSALLLERLGFMALATSSMGFALSIGKLDNAAGREAVMQHAEELTSTTNIPVSADLENGFGDAPETVVETIRMAAQAGLVGGSIEDATGQKDEEIYEFGKAVERVRAAAEAARSLPFPFTLTARAENFLHGRRDMKDTIRRLQAYQEAGADVLYAPGLTTKEEIVEVVRSVDRPVNVLMGLKGVYWSLEELSAMGVRRVSVGSGLFRVAYASFWRAAREMREAGTFTAIANEPMYGSDIAKAML